MEVVINKCYGGFGLSPEAVEAFLEKKGQTAHWFKWTFSVYGDKVVPITKEEARTKIGAVCYPQPEPLDNTAFHADDVLRNDPDLISVVKELGPKANTRFSTLYIVEIPDDVQWHVEEYDGSEWVAEDHRTWR